MVKHGILKREFRAVKRNLNLPDPNPDFTVDQVRDFYSATYPELVNASITGPEITDNSLKYEFSTIVGTKG